MRNYLDQTTGKLSDEDWAFIQSIIRRQKVAKNELILEEGKTCQNIWFLEQGAVRMFELQDGTENTTHFFLAPTFFTVYHSLLTATPSELFIKAEEDCILQTLPYKALSALYQQSHALERIGRIMAEINFMAEFDRRRMHLNMDALQRYEQLEARQPEVFQRFQLKDIATYLGITPVSLSRLRRYRSKKG